MIPFTLKLNFKARNSPNLVIRIQSVARLDSRVVDECFADSVAPSPTRGCRLRGIAYTNQMSHKVPFTSSHHPPSDKNLVKGISWRPYRFSK